MNKSSPDNSVTFTLMPQHSPISPIAFVSLGRKVSQRKPLRVLPALRLMPGQGAVRALEVAELDSAVPQWQVGEMQEWQE